MYCTDRICIRNASAKRQSQACGGFDERTPCIHGLNGITVMVWIPWRFAVAINF
jgi:hypothetical protein